MEKYGFVYIWYDSKRKMYYVGCHWGTEDDGYICSSSRMRKSYRRRPEDFKRRTIIIVHTNRENLLEEEFKWLSLIEDNELGKKYYNLRKHKWGHWSTNIDKQQSIGEKISLSLTGKKQSEKTRKKRSLSMLGKNKYVRTKSHNEKNKLAKLGNIHGCGNKGKKKIKLRTPWDTNKIHGNKGKNHTPETNEKFRLAKLGKKQSAETIAKRFAWREKE